MLVLEVRLNLRIVGCNLSVSPRRLETGIILQCALLCVASDFNCKSRD